MNEHYKNFIEKANKVHKNKYDYSKVEYINTKTKVTIICPIHGEFDQTPNSHLSGTNCPKCAGNFKFSTKEWIESAKIIHGSFYDYSKVKYINARTKVTIICPVHGEFEQRASSHLNGCGCSKCGSELRGKHQSSTIDEFIEKAKQVHFNRYNYSNVCYFNTKIKVSIICPEHGEFKQTPSNHLQGYGCPECKIQKLAVYNTREQEEIVKEFSKVHGTRYDYTKVNYINLATKVIIICKEHGEFKQTPNNHISGQGCPSCALTGFNKEKPAILYYLKITTKDNRILYKIGITNRSIKERFSVADLQKIEVVKVEEFSIGKDAYEHEQRIIKICEQQRYKGTAILDSGNTELFIENVLITVLQGNLI